MASPCNIFLCIITFFMLLFNILCYFAYLSLIIMRFLQYIYIDTGWKSFAFTKYIISQLYHNTYFHTIKNSQSACANQLFIIVFYFPTTPSSPSSPTYPASHATATAGTALRGSHQIRLQGISPWRPEWHSLLKQ